VGEPDEQEMKELEQALTKRAQKAVDIETRVLTFDKLIKIVHARAPTPLPATLVQSNNGVRPNNRASTT
jgi:FKBP-type peptidyl-prolyl cis-trans isomerase (trigger factor)